MIGPFYWQYRGDGGDICYCIACVHIFAYNSTREEFVCKILQFSVYINVQDSSVFYIDFVSDGAFEGI